MRKLDLDFEFDSETIEEKISRLSNDFKPASFNKEVLRKKLVDLGYDINNLTTSDISQKSILVVDSSFIEKELQFHCLWALHSVALYSKFDNTHHKDPIVGHGTIMYKDLMYDSFIDVGNIIPYDQIETRGGLIRMTEEYEFLIRNYELLKKEGIDTDYLIIDGSLYTNISHIKTDPHKFPEHTSALKAHEALIKTGRAIGMVEDSHSIDISKQIGINTTNIFLFDLILNPNEYVVDKKEDINICYIKLPSKKLSYTESRKSNPITVRWEFSFPNFEKDLKNLVGMWLLEDDLLHSQIYPVRITDYLTRKIKLSGLLEEIIKKVNLAPKFRDMREG